MRVTGGFLSGRKVDVPKGVIRPAMDRMRESVFAVLGDLTGKSFLDLFSGSGVIALEAASRGASMIEAVEKDPLKRDIILRNMSISPVRINCRFISVELYVKRAKKNFDYIFCDPPFNYNFKWELVVSIAGSPLVHENSILIIHRPRKDNCVIDIPNLKLIDTREYGRSIADFFCVRKGGLNDK